MKKERLFYVIGMIEDDLIKEAEDEQIVVKNWIQMTTWKWAVTAAGILLVIGTGIFYQSRNKNFYSTTSLLENNYIGTTASGIESYGVQETNPINDKKEFAEALDSWESSDEDGLEKEHKDGALFEEKVIVLYAEIIEEIYQPYKGGPLYLNLENNINLDNEQKEILLELLDSEYKIPVVTGRLEELFGQGIIDEKAEEITGVYLSIQLIDEEENGFYFQVDGWGGRNVTFTWENGYAFYEAEEWSYELGEEQR